MSSTWGTSIKYSIFGESHGPCIGITIDGLPSGINLNMDLINNEMDRRRPGKNNISTSRNEADRITILSGYFNNATTGSPLCAIIENNDVKSNDYNKHKSVMRPGHADFTGYIKYDGNNDYRGGGHFSGRLTAPVVFAGAIAKQILSEKGIQIGSHILQIGDIRDLPFDYSNISSDALTKLYNEAFPVLDTQAGLNMQQYIHRVKQNGDSVGGIIEAAIINLPAGIGSPFFDSVESKMSHILFSIPAVKGVEFGAGFAFVSMLGSEAKDEYYYDNETIRTTTNNNGGILGGITSGMPIVFKVAVKPTPSIAIPQRTVDVGKKENTLLNIQGRHDPCIVPRALPVIEAAAALAVLDLIL